MEGWKEYFDNLWNTAKLMVEYILEAREDHREEVDEIYNGEII